MADALGMIECRSFAAMVEASDAMVKAAKVELVGFEETGGGYVTAIVRGDVAAVKAAVDAGVRGGEKVGEVIATHVIARPHVNLDIVLPLGRPIPRSASAGLRNTEPMPEKLAPKRSGVPLRSKSSVCSASAPSIREISTRPAKLPTELFGTSNR